MSGEMGLGVKLLAGALPGMSALGEQGKRKRNRIAVCTLVMVLKPVMQ